MHSIAVVRAEQSAALKRGLALSAGIHLTFAVLLFGVIGVARELTPPVAVDEELPTDIRVIDVIEVPDGGPPPPPTPPAEYAGPAEIEPVDDDERPIDERQVEIAARPTDPGPASDGDSSGNPSGRNGTGITGDGPSNDSELDPNVYQPRDIEPVVIRRVIPEYPDVARQAGMEGEVMVRVLVGRDGTVRKVEIQRSSALFDDAAVEAVRQWTFRPAIWMDKPVAVWVRIPIVFRMN